MLLSIFIYLSCSLRNRAELGSQMYPIERGFCKVNIDGYQYAWLNFGDRRIDTKNDPERNYTYYIRYCKELTRNDIMDGGIIDDLTDVYAVRCHQITKKCDALITENAWDWKFYNASNKEGGIIYYAMGEPIKISDISYFTLDVQFVVSCDKSQPDYNASAKIIADVINTNEASLRITLGSSYGCGQKVDTPAPTPNIEPDCRYTDRYDPLMNYSIDIDLGKMNGGPFGVRSHNVTMDGANYTLFYQPCERMKCPTSYKCPNDEWSSAWICDTKSDSRLCNSYGVVPDKNNSFIQPLPDILDGVEVTYKSSDKSITFEVGCDRFLPMNHFDFASTMSKTDNNIRMKAKSQNACIMYYPDPTPPAAKCFFNRTNDAQSSTIELNMIDYDKGDMKGWQSDVTYQQNGKTVNGKLYYEPCDNVFCPAGAFCGGDEDATIYLCAPDEVDPSRQDCIAYGLLNNSIDMYFQNSYDITYGVKVDYYGDIGRTAVVNWKCDSSLTDKQLRLPSTVDLYKKELKFEVYSKSACGSNNPQPRPPWHPPTPKPYSPTPTPQPSVNPVDIYVINETHYMLTPLNTYQQDIYKGNMTIVYQGTQSQVYAEFHPWKFIPCPSGYTCSAGATESNFWVCWVEDDGTKYCHSVGDVRILNDMKPLSEQNPDEGVQLIFGGVYGFNSHFDIDCDPHESNDSIPFDRATVLAYETTKDGPILKAYLDSGAVCPRKFESIPMPPPAARQTPAPGYTPVYNYSHYQDGNTISIDLGNIQGHEEIINMGYFPHYERNLFKYYPKEPGDAPEGYTVLDDLNSNSNTKANVWRCFNASDGNKYCHSAGDARINLIYDLINDTDISHGLSINYEGGYGGFETHIQLICNESIPGKKVDFDDVGRYISVVKAPVIFAHTSMICPKKEPWHPPKPTPYAPTPTPQPSVNPVDIYVINETHYMLTPLNTYQQDVYKGTMTITHQDDQSHVYAEFHPWKFIPCPSGYTCSAGATESNFWVCWNEDDGTKYCHSVGDIRILNDMEPISKDNPDAGVVLIFGGVYGLDSHFDISCDYNEKNDSIPFDRATVLRYDTTLGGPILRAYLDSGAVCPRKFESIPMPPPAARQTPAPDYTPEYKYDHYVNDNYISIDLGDIETHEEIINMGYFPHYERNLFKYYPKEPGDAPAGYTVLDDLNSNSNTKANVWRCFNATDGNKYCHSAGDARINLIYDLINDTDVSHGLSINYEGGYGGFETHIQLICNESIPGKEVDFDDVGRYYSVEKGPVIFAHTSLICPKKKTWHPDKPTPYSPTPTPQPSVNPVDIYVINETHYILTPLNTYQQEVYKGNMTIVHKGSQSQVYAEFHPWDFIPCPSGYTCSAGATESNFWVCWVEDDGTKYCHSVGDIRILNDMKPMTEQNPDAGAELIFGGVYGFDSHFDIRCNVLERNDSIPFDRATVLGYELTLDGQILKAYLDSGAVCPRQFDSIPTPAPAPTKSPAPDYKPVYTYSKSLDNETYISLDLSKFEMHDEIINMGYFPHYQRNLFRYYPKEPGHAPDGYTVLDDMKSNSKTKANVWRCFNASDGKKYCHSAGDARTNLQFDLVNDSDLSHGLTVTYEGGYAGFSSHIQYICNESVVADKLDFDDVGVYRAQVKAPVIFAHTFRICPKIGPEPDTDDRGTITGGSIFLFIVAAGIVMYLTIGVLIGYIRNGMLEFPNSDFWGQFFECVETAIIFIFTCGKRGRIGGDAFLYDKAPE